MKIVAKNMTEGFKEVMTMMDRIPMNTASLIFCLALFLPPAATHSASLGRQADALVMDVDSASRLIVEGEAGYEQDGSARKTGFQYCANSVALADQREFRRAIKEASKALFLGKIERKDDVSGMAMRDLATAYSFAGDLDRAAEWAEKAIKSVPHFHRNANTILGRSYKTLGDVHLRRGNVAAAKKNYELALDFVPPYPLWKRFFQLSLANAFLAEGNTAEARKLIESANDKLDDKLAAFVRRGLGRVALAEGKFAEAISMFEGAINSPGGDDADYHRIWDHEGLARAYLASGDKEKGLAAYQEALNLTERVRGLFKSEEFKTGFFGTIQSIYDETITQMADTGMAEAAFNASERSRARAMLDAMGTQGASTLKPDVATTDASGIRKALPKETTAVIYHTLPKYTIAWIVRPSGMKMVKISEPKDRLAAEVFRFRQAPRDRIVSLASNRQVRSLVKSPRSGEANVGVTEESLGQSLYNKLIAPLDLSESDRSVVFVAHGVLHYLPFQALRGPKGYLIEERAISFVPSAGIAASLLAKAPLSRRKLLGLGNPDLGEQKFDLPGAELEIGDIKAAFRESEVFTRRNATKSAFNRHAPANDVIHIAAHAQVDEIDPMHSVIRLSPADGNDGAVTAAEIYNLNLQNTSLVTLSACDTGRGRITGGDEVWGFTRTFISAGTRSLIVTLWPVEDEMTREFMKEFYKGLQTASLQKAFQSAQLKLLRNSASSDPLFWAPFVLVGDWR